MWLDYSWLSFKYQIPTLEEMIPELSNVKVFTTLDANIGFCHIQLDEKSSKLITFWIPQGRYRWLRLPFRLSPAIEIFQMKLHQIVFGLKGVIPIDDLMVYGSGDTEKEAMKDLKEH